MTVSWTNVIEASSDYYSKQPLLFISRQPGLNLASSTSLPSAIVNLANLSGIGGGAERFRPGRVRASQVSQPLASSVAHAFGHLTSARAALSVVLAELGLSSN